MAGACQYGASPGPGSLAGDLIWLGTQFIAASDLAELLRVNPGLAGQVVQRLTNVGDLCASNPPVPEAMTVQDVLAAIVDPLVGPVLPETYTQKLADLITYTAFQAKCVCNQQPGVCASTLYDLNLSTNLQYRTDSLCFVWPTTAPGANTVNSNIFQPWPSTCPDVDITIWQNTEGSGSQPQLEQFWTDCVGHLLDANTFMGVTHEVTIRGGTCASGGPGIQFVWCWNVNPANFAHWQIRIAPHAGTGPPIIEPPIPPPPDTGTVPTPPALDCSTATQCDLLWQILKRVDTGIGRSGNITQIITGNNPPEFVRGNSYAVTGSGEQLVAAGTLAASVALTVLPSYIVPSAEEPPWTYNVGWVAASCADGWDSKQWLHAPTQRCFPRQPPMLGLAYNLVPGVEITITELLPA